MEGKRREGPRRSFGEEMRHGGLGAFSASRWLRGVLPGRHRAASVPREEDDKRKQAGLAQTGQGKVSWAGSQGFSFFYFFCFSFSVVCFAPNKISKHFIKIPKHLY